MQVLRATEVRSQREVREALRLQELPGLRCPIHRRGAATSRPLASRSVTLHIGPFLTLGAFMYVKLFGSILDSSIWSADLATRVVWITMLTMADEYGIVYASIDGLANRARISIPECRKALNTLLHGDRYSRTKNDRGTKLEGRRVEELEGGWQVINYRKYRELRSRKQIVDAARQARHRDESVTGRDTPVTTVTLAKTVNGHDVTVEAEAEAEEDTKTTTARSRAARAHWVRGLATIWRNRYHGEPPWGKIGKLLKSVKDSPDLARRFTAYLAVTEPQYVDLAKFVASFGSWGNGKPTPQTYAEYTPGQTGPNL